MSNQYQESLKKAFQKTEVACRKEATKLLQLVWSEEESGRHVGFDQFLEADVNQSSTSVQEFWRKNDRWGYEMVGYLKRWLARHPEAKLVQQSRGSYGFLDLKFELPDGTVVCTWGADADTRFGRDYSYSR